MSVRELVVLGTASQVPTRHRNHNGYLLRWDGDGFLFDPGEGTQRQMTIVGVGVHDISHVCVTHFHGDHCLGLAGVIQRCSLEVVPHPVTIHFPESGRAFYERLRHASLFDDRAVIVAAPIDRPGVIASGAGDTWTLTTRPLVHRVDSWGYRLVEPPRRHFLVDRLDEFGIEGPAVGELQRAGSLRVGARDVTIDEVTEERPGMSFALVMDTAVCDSAYELARGVDLLVCESTFLERDRDRAVAWGHMTARQAAELARDAGAKRLLLTHFSQRYAPDGHEFLAEAKAVFGNCDAAYDGLRISLR
jgi:ribonuclease Z